MDILHDCMNIFQPHRTLTIKYEMCTRVGGLCYFVAIQWGVKDRQLELGEIGELERARRARGWPKLIPQVHLLQ